MFFDGVYQFARYQINHILHWNWDFPNVQGRDHGHPYNILSTTVLQCAAKKGKETQVNEKSKRGNIGMV